MEYMSALLIPAGPVDLGYFSSQETYITPFPASPVPCYGGEVNASLPEPPDQIPRVHLGYGVALESLAVSSQTKPNLKTVLEGLPGDEIELYVTGHSLGAAVPQLFSA